MRHLKTPLRYPGGKSRAVKTLYNWFPSTIKEYREPFCGGSSMALYFSQLHPEVPVWINDKYEYLYNFWITLQQNGDKLSDTLYAIKQEHATPDLAKQLFNRSKEEISEADPFRQAVLFWILNKCSYSGLTENSAFSETASRQNFTLRGAANLKKYQEIIANWVITNSDYSDLVMEPGEDVFVFLDPPYKINSFLYGTNAELHKGFDHKYFIDTCKVCPHQWMVTYNVDEEIEKEYDGYHQRYFSLTYGMQHRANNKKDELLVTNYNVQPPNPLEVLLYGEGV
ncbi:cytosine-specific DNA methyltransferase [Synechococcus phage S-SZBM1]|uniref:Cytosine-specific DNA methyltransferase n=1 Tax=Synechococcus phage S-SZBM1 TaxID=2926475 RepID=A0AC61TST0_9CAUD|nr:cytosine-specific DNA methyltransferase [Synechococcus phage S-SZBM1]UNH61273.1 cytosine-specific DNA methyltransferase [Synechococcus phage S-SZBM1]